MTRLKPCPPPSPFSVCLLPALDPGSQLQAKLEKYLQGKPAKWLPPFLSCFRILGISPRPKNGRRVWKVVRREGEGYYSVHRWVLWGWGGGRPWGGASRLVALRAIRLTGSTTCLEP